MNNDSLKSRETRALLSSTFKDMEEEHNIATSLDHLAAMLQATDQFYEAEPLYRKALKIRKATLPAGHPDIAISLNNLAGLLRATGRHGEAERLLQG